MKRKIEVQIREDDIEHSIVCSECLTTVCRFFLEGKTVLQDCDHLVWSRKPRTKRDKYVEDIYGRKYYLLPRK